MLSAQIPTRRQPQQTNSNVPRLLVANPHSFTATDSAPAVAIGEGIRGRVDKIAGSQFRVLTRVEMNEALKQFGYPADAILAPMTQRVLAQSLNSRVVVVDRKSLNVLYQFGGIGTEPGKFQGPHHGAVDSKGNLYTVEVLPGNRAQRFVFKGPVSTPPANALTPAQLMPAPTNSTLSPTTVFGTPEMR